MTRRKALSRFVVRTTLAAALALAATVSAVAADAPAPTSKMDEMVITGSYIRGTQEDEALPVSVFTAELLAEQGSPNMVELVQRIPSVNGGNLGESNRFLGGAPQGTATINLRGLGLTRTLVLMNGQRLPTINAVGADYIDVNQVPMAALARVEVLREGAAATYGSDAVAGVVNFITRRDLNGFEFKGSFKAVQDTDGQYDGSVAYGWTGEKGNFILSASYAKKTEARLTDFDFMLPSHGQDGFSGSGNPGSYTALASKVDADNDGGFEAVTLNPASFRDLGCVELGGSATGSATRPTCRYPYSLTDAPINDEKHWNLFAEANYELSDSLRFHAEGHWARNIVPNIRESVSLLPINSPAPIEASGDSGGGGSSPIPAQVGNSYTRYYIPANNPGLIALMTNGGCPASIGEAMCAQALANGVVTQSWRPRALGGSPSFGGDTDQDYNETTSFRISAGFDGDFENGWGWTARVGYGQGERNLEWSDLSINRVQLGLRGLGGPGCNPVNGSPGVGACQWFNTFANSIERSLANGKSYTDATGRPLGPVVTESLWSWMRQPLLTTVTSQLVTVEAVVNGDFGTFSLPGGEPSWAFGGQWRYTDRRATSNDAYDPIATPCPDSPPYGDGVPGCVGREVGGFLFRSPEAENYFHRDVLAFFGELKLPVLDSVELALAVRREEYGGEIGSTTNPRVALRWQAFSWLAFRGTAGTTFRAPPESISTPGTSRFQGQFTNPVTGVAAYRAIDITNAALEPEEAKTYNVGMIIATDDLDIGGTNIGAFNLTLDYYIINFEKELSAESQVPVYNAMFKGSADPTKWDCGNDALRSRFTFTPPDSPESMNNTVYGGRTFASCHPNNFNVVGINRLNGASTDIKGIDIAGAWIYPDLFGGDLEIGADASYMLQYERSAVSLIGTSIVTEPEVDRAGTTELLSSFFSFPEWRTNAHLKYSNGDHNIRWDTRFYSATEDNNRAGKRGEGQMLHDLSYRWASSEYNVTVTATVANVLDDEPPYYRSQFNYDYVTYSPLGRTYEIGLEYKLGEDD